MYDYKIQTYGNIFRKICVIHTYSKDEIAHTLYPAMCRCSATAVAEKSLQTPHGGKLVDLMLPEAQKAAEIASCTKEMDLSDRNACDTELLVVG